MANEVGSEALELVGQALDGHWTSRSHRVVFLRADAGPAALTSECRRAASAAGFLVLQVTGDATQPMSHQLHLASMREREQLSASDWRSVTRTMHRHRADLIASMPGHEALADDHRFAPFLATSDTTSGVLREASQLARAVVEATGRGGLCIVVDAVDRCSLHDRDLLAELVEMLGYDDDPVVIVVAGADKAVADSALAKVVLPVPPFAVGGAEPTWSAADVPVGRDPFTGPPAHWGNPNPPR